MVVAKWLLPLYKQKSVVKKHKDRRTLLYGPGGNNKAFNYVNIF